MSYDTCDVRLLEQSEQASPGNLGSDNVSGYGGITDILGKSEDP